MLEGWATMQAGAIEREDPPCSNRNLESLGLRFPRESQGLCEASAFVELDVDVLILTPQTLLPVMV